ncbi:hypothetical protein [Shinella oryzae]|uniref:hypothetical protein n=1 Tax=Shinella oryzae TaxID=2871820 RepID=UPI001FF4D9B0|nr:hypothetical protein [Shinella oryzae]UPA25351.1 hypothetical protein K6301_03875 [Shinella oryzae]
MSILNEDIFTNYKVETITVSRSVSVPTRLDPLAELMHDHVEVDYKARYARSTVAFMDFSKGDRRWIDHLIEELTKIGDVYREDKIIMLGWSTAKPRNGKQQTWQKFVDELYADKTLTRQDYSEAQLKHLPVLIRELSKGKRLAGCHELGLREVTSRGML